MIATLPRIALEIGHPFSAPVASSLIVAAVDPFQPFHDGFQVRRHDLDARVALVGGDRGGDAHARALPPCLPIVLVSTIA